MNQEDKNSTLNSLKIIHSLSKLGLQKAVPFLMELKIKIYNFFGSNRDIERQEKKDFFDDLLVGDAEEIESDLLYLIYKLTGSKNNQNVK
jgi:hypothetical protein